MGLKEGMGGSLQTGIGTLQPTTPSIIMLGWNMPVAYGCFHATVGELSHGEQACMTGSAGKIKVLYLSL